MQMEFSVVAQLGAQRSALERELLRAVGVHGAPVGLVGSLAVVAGGVGLPGLVEGLEEEGVDAPVESTAALRKEC
jgi:hypothetical protein